MPTAGLPRAQAQISDQRGYPTREWYAFFTRLLDESTDAGLSAQIQSILDRLKQLEAGSIADLSIIGLDSVSVIGQPSSGRVTITLEGDAEAPGATWYYGTGQDGVRSWYQLSDGFSVTSDLTKDVDALTGVTTFGLSDLSDTGTGDALVKITRDAKGRVEGTEAATTDDLNEGAVNLYFTDARAQDALQGTVDDLQGQIDERLTYTSLKSTLVAGANTTLTPDDNAETITITATGGGVSTITGGTGVSVNNADPDNPVVSLTAATLASLALADSATQPGDLATVATSGSYADLSDKPTLGTAAASDAADFDPAGAASTAVASHVADSDPHPQYATPAEAAAAAPVQSVNGKTGAVSVTKGDVGLDNVDNTSDANKPISTAQAEAINARMAKGFAGNTDLNQMTLAGSYRFETPANSAGLEYGQLLVIRGGADTVAQMVFDYNGYRLCWRSASGANDSGATNWSAWREIWHSGNFNPDYKANLSDLGTMAAIDDAPIDGKTYGRKDGGWAEAQPRSNNLDILSSPTWYPEITNENFVVSASNSTEVSAGVKNTGGGTAVFHYYYKQPAGTGAPSAGFLIGGCGSRPWNGSGWSNHSTAAYHLIATEDHSQSAQGTDFAVLATPIGGVQENRIYVARFNGDGDIINSLGVTSRKINPAERGRGIELARNGNTAEFSMVSSSVVPYATLFRGYAISGSLVSPAATQNGTGTGFALCGHDGNSIIGAKAIFSLRATGNWTSISTPTEINLETTSQGSTARTLRWKISDTGSILAGSDNVYDIGSASLRPKQIYAASSTISTSDARLKTSPRDACPEELAAFGEIARLPMVWKWLERAGAEGDSARLHSGPTVQAAISIMQAHDLDWTRYSAFCYDEWEETPEQVRTWEEDRDEDGNVTLEAGSEITEPYRPAGNRYSFRKEELLWWCMRAMFAEHDALVKRVAAMESA